MNERLHLAVNCLIASLLHAQCCCRAHTAQHAIHCTTSSLLGFDEVDWTLKLCASVYARAAISPDMKVAVITGYRSVGAGGHPILVFVNLQTQKVRKPNIGVRLA